jgi:hypothetical protein
MKCDNCENQATMHKHYERSDGTFADSYLCGKCFADKFLHYDTCQWCGNFITSVPYIDNQGRKYCSFDCVKRFMGYEDECFDIQSAEEHVKTIYHVVKVNSDDSFNPTTKNIIYTGEKQDAQEIFSKRIAESQDSELYALVCQKIIMKVLEKQRGVITG